MAQHKMWYSYYVPVIVCRPIFNAVVRRTCAARTLCVGLQGFSGPKKASHFVFDPFLLLRFAFTQHQKDRFWQKIQKNTCVAFLKRTPLDAKSGLSDKSPYSRRRHGQQISFAEGFGKKSSDCSHPRHRNAFIIQLISHQAKESESQIMKTKKKTGRKQDAMNAFFGSSTIRCWINSARTHVAGHETRTKKGCWCPSVPPWYLNQKLERVEWKLCNYLMVSLKSFVCNSCRDVLGIRSSDPSCLGTPCPCLGLYHWKVICMWGL